MKRIPWYVYTFVISIIMIGILFTACESRPQVPVTAVVQVAELPNSNLIYNDGNTKVVKIIDNDITCYLATNTTLRVSPSIFCIK